MRWQGQGSSPIRGSVLEVASQFRPRRSRVRLTIRTARYVLERLALTVAALRSAVGWHAKATTTEARLEQVSDAQRREASRAGLLATVLFVLLALIALLTVISFWPVFTSAPVTETAPKAA